MFLFKPFKQKRGIAPLIATALLIILAVALGVVVMNFGRAQVEISNKCAVEIGLKITELNQQEQVCLDKIKNQIYFIAENGPNVKIEALRLQVIGTKAILVQDLTDSSLEKLTPLMRYVPYDYNKYGDIRQFKLIPKIELYGEEILCPEMALIPEKVRECQK